MSYKLNSNPFSLSFGREPKKAVERIGHIDEIIGTFLSDVPSEQIFLLTGVRGSGSTETFSSIRALCICFHLSADNT
ncbi:MAG: hypothetical protein MJ052_04715 [Sphaerochaetaceae bacterium]|nr:hypothetical protein [Sphaerochaetaceae bacterium]